MDANVQPIGLTCITLQDGTRMWVLDDEIHREDGPAIEKPNGTRMWLLHDELHREDGPAVETPWLKKWYRHDKLHREDGPAIDGVLKWFLNGEEQPVPIVGAIGPRSAERSS